MKETTREICNQLIQRYPQLKVCEKDVLAAFERMKQCFANGNRLYVCGNGGSASDSEHIVGELVKSFKKFRPLSKEFAEKLQAQGEDSAVLIQCLEGGLPAVSLCGHPSLSTAFANDKNPMLTFAQQVSVYGRAGDVLWTISTSGNSKNCIYATLVAKALGMQTFTMTGGTGGELKSVSDVAIVVPEKETYRVQELHLPIYHALCAMLEEEFFDGETR